MRLLHFAGGPKLALADCGLVHVAPGVRFAVFRPGDLVHRAPGSAHAFRVTSGEPYVFAMIVERGIRFTEPAAR